jgi:hypothetical protein
MKKQLLTFAAVCVALNKNEADYAIPEAGTNKEKVAVCRDRAELISKAFNGDQKVNMADTDQWKYFPIFEIIPDSEQPGGLRLAYRVYGIADDCSSLGGRPPFLDSDDAIFAGEQFLEEYQRLMQFEALALME